MRYTHEIRRGVVVKGIDPYVVVRICDVHELSQSVLHSMSIDRIVVQTLLVVRDVVHDGNGLWLLVMSCMGLAAAVAGGAAQTAGELCGLASPLGYILRCFHKGGVPRSRHG